MVKNLKFGPCKSLLQQLQSTALDVSLLHWTPGHATIAGNEIADRLAKDAAQQALEMPVDISIVTIQDIENSSKKSIVSKWQQRWDISESGRFLQTFKPLVDSKPYLDLQVSLSSHSSTTYQILQSKQIDLN